MNNVKTFPGAQPYVNPEEPLDYIVKAIEQLLAYAKSGELRSFAGMGFLTGNNRISVLTYHDNVYEFIGGIDMLKHDYMNRFDEVDY